MTKDKTIIVKWSKKEKDILYSWGNGIPKPDVNLIHNALDYNFIDKTQDIYNGLLKELEKRGYDMTTFKLIIKRR